jgi:hypothetical protein
MLEDQSVGRKGIKVSQEITINIYWTKKSVIVEIGITKFEIKRARGLREKAVIN